MPLGEAFAVEEALLFKDTIVVAPTSREDFYAALQEAKDAHIGLTDALALTSMKGNGLSEIYSFDRDFDRIGDVRRIGE
jgi:predicted nucleic acid-binding protein